MKIDEYIISIENILSELNLDNIELLLEYNYIKKYLELLKENKDSLLLIELINESLEYINEINSNNRKLNIISIDELTELENEISEV